MRCYEAAGDIVKKVRSVVKPLIKKDARLVDIAGLVESHIINEGGQLAFPCTIAVNDIASHYTPAKDDQRAFAKGDVVKLDLGASVDGYIADAAFTVETETDAHARLIKAAEKALAAGLAQVRPGVHVGEIGRAIDKAASEEGLHVLKELLGHSLLKISPARRADHT